MANTKGRTSTTKTTKRDVNAATRAALAIELRAKKLTYDEIARQAGYASRGACYDAIQRELKRVVSENVEELRREDMHTLDQLQKMCWKLADDDENKGRLFAVDRILQILERRAKLMGMDQTSGNVATAQVVIREAPPGYFGTTTATGEQKA